MQISVVPERFRQEPVDMVAYDAWQDREGLVDASPGVRAAWASWQGEWRAQRRIDLEAEPDDAPLYAEPMMPEAMARAARALGVVVVYGRRPDCGESERGQWRAWRRRMIQANPDAYWCAVGVLNGAPLAVVAARLGLLWRDALGMVISGAALWRAIGAELAAETETRETYLREPV